YASWDSTPTEADIQGFHSSEPDFFLVAELNRRIVGFVYGRESKNVPDEVLRRWKATRVGSVEVLAVEEQYRRRGIATLLMDRLFVVFKGRGIDTVTLTTPADEIRSEEHTSELQSRFDLVCRLLLEKKKKKKYIKKKKIEEYSVKKNEEKKYINKIN